MNANVVRLILATIAAAILVIAAAFFLFPIRPEIGGPPGLLFWTIATLAASALPVRLPRGVVVSVASAPILASMLLGGPTAAALVSLIGTTDEREIRGRVPWYGTVYNHAAAATSAAVAGILYDSARSTALAVGLPAEFVLALFASAVFLIMTWAFAVAAVAIRTATSMRVVWVQDI